ncbi:aldehyde dehydrogenase family protein [Deltaproteobacteria bacterium TL4]
MSETATNKPVKSAKTGTTEGAATAPSKTSANPKPDVVSTDKVETPTSRSPQVIESFNPATGEKIGEVPVTPIEEMPRIFEEARKAQKIWAEMTFDQRKECLLKMRDYMMENTKAIAKVISKDNGKTLSDALNTEVIPSILACDWYAKKAKQHLKKKNIPASNVLFANKQSYLLRMPLGVVGIISPWNYPFSIPFGEVMMGLMAGNAILLKTAVETAMVGAEIEKIIKAGCLPKGLFHYVQGRGSQVATAWFENKIDKIFFTGSVGVGQILMKQAAENVTPLSLELGGKDAMIVLEDANLERAANGAVWGGFQNSGQTCAGVERVYVHESVAEEFLKLVKEKTESLRQGADSGRFDKDIGAMTTVSQLELVKRHVADALKQGAKIYAQSTVSPDEKGLFHPATVLVDVTHDMDVMKEETFGPVIGVMTFKTDREAIALANDSDLGLTSSVWTTNNDRGRKMAKQLETGITTLNDHIYTHGSSELPWVGWKKSGLGATHSHLGLEEMTKPKVVSYDLAPNIKADLWWFPHREIIFEAFADTPKLLFGKSLQVRADSLGRLIPKLLKDPLLKEKMMFVFERARKRGKQQFQKALGRP